MWGPESLAILLPEPDESTEKQTNNISKKGENFEKCHGKNLPPSEKFIKENTTRQAHLQGGTQL